jgi:hypothetical protein
VGLLINLFVAVDMIWRGSREVVCAYAPESVCKAGLVSAIGSPAGW